MINNTNHYNQEIGLTQQQPWMSKIAKRPSEINAPSKFTSLSDIFHNDKNLAWDILDSECLIYTESQVNLESITNLAALYMRIIETLNGLQDKRQGYFSSKMQKLMREPFITRCFNQQIDNRKDVLQNRRKELEQRVEQESLRHGHRRVLEQAIKAQEMKQQNVRQKIKVIEQESNQMLEQRIKRRNQMRENKSIISPKRDRERSQYYSRTISSGERSFDISAISAEFELKADEDEKSLFRNLQRELAAEEEQIVVERKLLRERQKNG